MVNTKMFIIPRPSLDIHINTFQIMSYDFSWQGKKKENGWGSDLESFAFLYLKLLRRLTSSV